MQVVSVDFQNDFVAPGGVHYRGQPCLGFIEHTLLPWCRTQGIAVAEIISDYRSTNGDDQDTTCVPGQWGFRSALPAGLTRVPPWVKASIAPTWTRDGAGRPDQVPGPVRADPDGLTSWLESALGPADRSGPVVVVGLVLEVCVLASLIDLRLRGYPAAVLVEGVDTYDGDAERKRMFLDTLAGFWGPPVTWANLRAKFHGAPDPAAVAVENQGG